MAAILSFRKITQNFKNVVLWKKFGKYEHIVHFYYIDIEKKVRSMKARKHEIKYRKLINMIFTLLCLGWGC
jgi:hypothetical protein